MKLNDAEKTILDTMTDHRQTFGHEQVVEKLAELGCSRLNRRVEVGDTGSMAQLLEDEDRAAIEQVIGLIAEQCALAAIKSEGMDSDEGIVAEQFVDRMLDAGVALTGILSSIRITESGEDVIREALGQMVKEMSKHDDGVAKTLGSVAKDLAKALGVDEDDIVLEVVPEGEDLAANEHLHDLLANMKPGVEHA